MGKTKSCKDQNKIHNKAKKLRKMTDEQLVHYVEKKRKDELDNEIENCYDIYDIITAICVAVLFVSACIMIFLLLFAIVRCYCLVNFDILELFKF